MSATQGDLASLSRYIFRAPRWYASVGFALVVAAVAGVGAFDAGYVLEDAWQGVFFIGVPTVVASLLTTPVDRRLGGQLTYNRSSLLALTCEGVVVAVMAGAGAATVLFAGLEQGFVFDALIVALASVFALRLLVILAISGKSVIVAAVPASVQTAAAALLVFVYSGTMQYLYVGGGPLVETFVDIAMSRAEEAPPELGAIVAVDFVLLGLLCVLYGVAVWAFVRFIDRPWERSLGVSMLDFLRGFVGHIAEGTDELEDFFEQIGEKAVVPVTVLAFRRDDAVEGTSTSNRNSGSSDDGSEKARFVLPMIHPGPMGEIGGGNLPRRVAERADGLAFPPHATAGHDFNLVTERELESVIETAESAYEQIEYGETATPAVRAQSGDAKVFGQAFGDDLLLTATYAPGFADDIMYAVGLSAAAEGRSSGFDDVLLADAHNSNDGLSDVEDLGHVYPGSERSFDLMAAAREAATELGETPQHSIRLGTAWDPTDWEPREGIGPLGVRVAVFEVGDRTAAYVLVDGNNMEPGLRDRILTAIEGVDDAEVLTTDNHVVNTVEAENQVGSAIPQDELVALIVDLVAEARADCEPVAAGMATERAEVTVFGNDRTETLASHANAVVSMGGALAGAVIVAAMAISLVIFFLT
jgi:putative membrane protein